MCIVKTKLNPPRYVPWLVYISGFVCVLCFCLGTWGSVDRDYTNGGSVVCLLVIMFVTIRKWPPVCPHCHMRLHEFHETGAMYYDCQQCGTRYEDKTYKAELKRRMG